MTARPNWGLLPAFDPARDGPVPPDLVEPGARAVYPQMRGWTERIVDARCDPRTKLLAAIHGEPQRRAARP